MIYKIKRISEDTYEVSFQNQTVEVDYLFLSDKLKPHKKDELSKEGITSVRDTWIFPDNVQQQKVDIKNKETFQYPHGYQVESSKHEGLYELWHWGSNGGWRFVAYLFHLESVETLIREDKSWVKYSKSLKKNLIEVNLGKPIKEII